MGLEAELGYKKIVLILGLLYGAFLFWFSGTFTFWCDEFAWIGFMANPFVKFFELIRHEPYGPFDEIFMWILSHTLLHFGIQIEVAMRAVVILFILASALAPVILLPSRRSFLWSLWFMISVPVMYMATNARPYAGLIFWGTITTVFFLKFSAEKKLTSSSQKNYYWFSLLVLLGSLSHPYIIYMALPAYFALGYFWKSSDRKNARWSWWLILFYISICVIWYQLIRYPTPFQPVDFKTIQQRLVTENWKEVMYLTRYAFTGYGTKAIIVWILSFVGAFLFWKENPRNSKGILAMIVLYVSGSSVLNLRHNYSFEPRQLYGLLPIFGYFQAAFFDRVLEKAKQNNGWQLRGLFVSAAYFVFGIILPVQHYFKNIPPFIDIPHNHMDRVLNELSENGRRTVIYFSACQRTPVKVYFNQETKQKFVEAYTNKTGIPEYKDLPIHLWSNDWRTCLGYIPPNPDNMDILQKVKANPKGYALLMFQGGLVPASLREIPCKTEYQGECRLQ